MLHNHPLKANYANCKYRTRLWWNAKHLMHILNLVFLLHIEFILDRTQSEIRILVVNSNLGTQGSHIHCKSFFAIPIIYKCMNVKELSIYWKSNCMHHRLSVALVKAIILSFSAYVFDLNNHGKFQFNFIQLYAIVRQGIKSHFSKCHLKFECSLNVL